MGTTDPPCTPVESTFRANHSVLHEMNEISNMTDIISDKIGSEQPSSSSASIAAEALQTFEYVDDNIYKGNTEGLAMIDEMMPCNCQYNPDEPSSACGDYSDCINRVLFIECVEGECPVGRQYCQNRRYYTFTL